MRAERARGIAFLGATVAVPLVLLGSAAAAVQHGESAVLGVYRGSGRMELGALESDRVTAVGDAVAVNEAARARTARVGTALFEGSRWIFYDDGGFAFLGIAGATPVVAGSWAEAGDAVVVTGEYVDGTTSMQMRATLTFDDDGAGRPNVRWDTVGCTGGRNDRLGPPYPSPLAPCWTFPVRLLGTPDGW